MASGMTASAGYPFSTPRGTSYLLRHSKDIKDARVSVAKEMKFTPTYHRDLNWDCDGQCASVMN